MRGAPGRSRASLGSTGIIPAYAGSTPQSSPARGARWDHPRVCGEHCALQGVRGHGQGSSPRMRRGALLRLPAGGSLLGIIPAYAGSTYCPYHWHYDWQDHPRVCGEHRRYGKFHHPCHGIIPAYAGSTQQSTSRWRCIRDHPRVCGEHCNRR